VFKAQSNGFLGTHATSPPAPPDPSALQGDGHLSYYAEELEHICEDLKTSLEADGFYVALDYEALESGWSGTGKGRFYISW
jgi:hypothetical protein